MDKETLFKKWVSFTASVHQVTHELRQHAKSDSITPVQYHILEYLMVSQPVTPSEISDCQHIPMPNTSRELKKLTEKNLIKRVNDPEDRRKQYIRLSKEGESMMNKTFATIESRFEKRLQHASKEEIEEMKHALDLLQKKLFY